MMRNKPTHAAWIRLAVYVPLVLILGFWAQHGFRHAAVRGTVSRARTDMRSLAMAIEAYMVDRMITPSYARGEKSVNGHLGPDHPAFNMPTFPLPVMLSPDAPDRTFPIPNRLRYCTLTTPLSYIMEFPLDPFVKDGQATFAYWRVWPGERDPDGKPFESAGFGIQWILVSPGPDGDYDLAGEWNAVDPGVAQPSPHLLAGTNKSGSAFTYDPTNGILSSSDIWRVKM